MIKRADNPRFIVPALPPGSWTGVITVDNQWRGVKFFEAHDKIGDRPAGTVYVISHRDLNLTEEYGANDRERRTWCRLAKVPYKELRFALNERNRTHAEKANQESLKRLHERAKQLGMKLVKIGRNT